MASTAAEIINSKEFLQTVSHARYLAEFLLAGVCTDEIHLRHYEGDGPARDRPGMGSTGWHMAGGRDRRLIRLLFPQSGITNAQEIPQHLYDMLNALSPARPGAGGDLPPGGHPPADLPAHLQVVRNELAKALAPRGEDLLAEVKLGLDDALYPVISDAHERSEAAELRRIYGKWSSGQRRKMDAIYREALAAFLAYAGIDANGE